MSVMDGIHGQHNGRLYGQHNTLIQELSLCADAGNKGLKRRAPYAVE